jgi:uncharacterized repeat protein (TIGR01451 family)
MKRKKFRLPRFGLGVAAMFALASPVQAFQRVEFSQNVEVETVVTGAEGQRKVSFAAPETVIPGDRLRFTLQLDNRTSESAAGLKFVNPIPPEVRFASTDDLAGFSVSVDGGKTWGNLADLTVSVAGAGPRAAGADDVTHVQWILPEPLAAGAVKKVTFFGIVR